MCEELFFLFFRQTDSSSSVQFEAQTQHTQRTSHHNSRFIIIIIMLRKGVNNGRSKLSLSVMKKDKSKNSTYILVNQVRFLIVFVVFFVFLSLLSSLSSR